MPPSAIDYRAKDYARFRAMMLARLRALVPDWNEENPADLMVTLVELLAYEADRLSYFQDAVSTEAHLATARLRTSVRRHARLLDYHMHDGCNARAVVVVLVASDLAWEVLANSVAFVTYVRIPEAAYCVIPEATLAPLHQDWYEWFEPAPAWVWSGEEGRVLRRELNSVAVVHDGTGLARGATTAVVEGARPPAPGDVVVFTVCEPDFIEDEAPIGATELPRAAAVKVRGVSSLSQEPPRWALEWAKEDAPSQPLTPRGAERLVLFGNAIVVDHGRTTEGDLAPNTEAVGFAGGVPLHDPARPQRGNAALLRVAATRVTRATRWRRESSLSVTLEQDPLEAEPVIAPASNGSAAGAAGWRYERDLLSCGPGDRAFTVEEDDDGRSTLRFGDGAFGARPELLDTAAWVYRVGSGVRGHVRDGAIARVVARRGADLDRARAILRVWNPLPAAGGLEPEPVATVRRDAPHAWRVDLRRAVTPEDYANAAMRDPDVAHARATFERVETATRVAVAIDPRDRSGDGAALRSRVARDLDGLRCMGHAVTVVPPREVCLVVEARVVVDPKHQRDRTRDAVRAALGEAMIVERGPAFFHPSRASFGHLIYESALLAEVQRVPGVSSVGDVAVSVAGRPWRALRDGVFALGDDEVARPADIRIRVGGDW